MFVRTKIRASGKTAVQIVESYRKASGISQRVVRHVGQGANEFEIEELKKLALVIIDQLQNERKPRLPLFDPLELADNASEKLDVPDNVKLCDTREEQRFIDGIADVFGAVYDSLGFDRIITGSKKNTQWNAYLRTMVLARIANPVSKRRTASLMEEDFGIKMSLEKIYRTLDHVYRCESSIKGQVAAKTLSLFDEEVNILLFDVTTLYFESFDADELREFGFSKDCKFKETQVVLALVTTTSGLPLTYRLFPGNTYEGHTLLQMIEELSVNYRIAKIVLVADRAMFTEDNLSMMEKLNVKYIVAAKLLTMSKSTKEQILQSASYRAQAVNGELRWVSEFEYKQRRLIVEYSPCRAHKDSSDRERLIKRLMKKTKDGKIALKELIPNYGSKKYIKVNGEKAEINSEKIESDGKWDGLHGVITNIDASDMSFGEVLSRYRDLWRIEESFRINKHDLKMRPIFHYTPERIKAHVALCFIAYSTIKHVLFRLEQQDCKISFEQLRNELLHAQSSLLVDVKTKRQYVLPSKTTQTQRKIYSVFGLRRRESPYVFD